jgi:CO/xanthine dehydrogenase Mo-binding subunit
MSEFRTVGKSIPNVDGVAKVTGSAKYVIDMELPRMLWGKVKRSTKPHALIKNIDTAKAEQLPGVVAVLTAKDVPDTRHGVGLSDEPIIARNRVRFIGESVAAVAAESEDIAAEAIKLIEVEYEDLPATYDPEEAFKPNPDVIVHPDLSKYHRLAVTTPVLDKARPNVLNKFKIVHGDVNKGFEQADHIFEGRFYTPMVAHVQMEPHNCIALWHPEPDDTIELWTSTQSPYMMLEQICEAFKTTEAKARVHIPLHVGGGFGGKCEATVDLIAVALSRKCGNKPVKMRLTREEVFVTSSVRHPIVIYLKTGVKDDGTIVAQDFNVILDSAANLTIFITPVSIFTSTSAAWAP